MKKFIPALLLTLILSSCVVVSPRPVTRYTSVYSNGHCYPIRTYNNPPFFFPFGYRWLWW